MSSEDPEAQGLLAKKDDFGTISGKGNDDEGTDATTTTTYTFNIEYFRFLGLMGMVGLLLVGKYLTDNYVDIPPEETVVYELFGFNHACNYLDHYPARPVSAIFVQLFTIPMGIFIIGSYFRTRHAYQSGMVPKWLATYNDYTTVFNFLANLYFYMVFVNPPYDEHTGFIGHYLPYLAWKISQAFLAIEQVYFLSHTGTGFPFGVTKPVAVGYAYFMVILTILYGAVALTVTFGHPFILDPAGNERDRFLARTMMTLYTVLVVFVQAAIAFYESRNGNLTTVSFSNVYASSA